MNRFRPIILLLVLALSAFAAYGPWKGLLPMDLGLGSTIDIIINVLIFIVFLLLFALEGIRGRVKAMSVFKDSCINLCIAVGVLALGELAAYLSAKAADVPFNAFGKVEGIGFADLVVLASVILILSVVVILYCVARRNAIRQKAGSMRASAAHSAAVKHAYNSLYSILTLVFLFAFVFVFMNGGAKTLIVSLSAATLAMILWHLTSWKVWFVLAIAVIATHGFAALYTLSASITIGALGITDMLAFCDIMVLVSLADLYLISDRVSR